MKVNRTRSIAKKRMKIAGNKKNRPEQNLAKLLIEKILDCKIQSEYFVNDLKPVGEKDFALTNQIPTLDLAVVDRKIAIRLQGQYHDEKRQMRKDRIQKYVLEGNGWNVIDLVHTDFPRLFQKRNSFPDRCTLMRILSEIYIKLESSGVQLPHKLILNL